MKKIILILFVFLGIKSYCQTYNPSIHVPVNDAISPGQATPTDSRSQFYDGTNFVYRDYNGTTEVLLYLNLGKYRFGHFPIYVHVGGSLSLGIWTGGVAQIWWFKNGTADSNLVRWYADSTILSPEVDTLYRKNDSILGFTIAHGPERTVLLRGTAAGGISSLSMAAPLGIFATPVNFSNTGGAWTGTLSLNNQNPNTIFAGPTTGGPGAVSFRAMVVGDLPTGIPNGNLQNSSISFGTGTSGSDVNWSSSSVNLGAGQTLNIPNASLSARGVLTSAAYTIFLNKVDSTTQSNDSVYEWRGGVKTFRYLLVAGSGTVTNFSFTNANGFTGIVTNASSTPNLTVGTSVTGLLLGNGTAIGAATVSSPLTYSAGTLGIQVANASQNGYLSSTDWNTFNNKISGAGNLTPLFTTSIVGGSIVFTPLATSAYTAYGNFTNVSATPSFSKIPYQAFAVNSPNLLFGWDGSGNPSPISLTTSGTTGAATLSATVLNIPQYQGQLTLTTTGSSGPSTLIGNILNVPQYSGGGSSLPSGVTPLYLQATGTSTYQWGDPRQLDTIYIVYSGQSNAGGGAEDIGDTLSDSRVLVWDYNAVVPHWVVAHVGVSPFNTTAPVAHSPTAWWYFGRKMARLTGKYVKIVGSFANATSITAWFNLTTRGAQTDTLLNRCAASGIPRVDYFIWDQGESDPSMPATQWSNAFDSLRFTLRRQTYFPATARTCIEGMPDTLSGAQPGFQGQEPTMMAYGYGLDPLVCFASTHIFPGADTVHVNAPGGNQIHFSSNGYLKMGDRIWDAVNSIPMRDFERGQPGGVAIGSTINPGWIKVNFNAIATTGAEEDGLQITNHNAAGLDGVTLFNDNGSGELDIRLTGSTANYLGTNTASFGTATNSDVVFHRNFIPFLKCTFPGGVTNLTIPVKAIYTAPQQFDFNNAGNSASGAGFTETMDGSIFYSNQLAGSTNVLLPGTLKEFLTSGYVTIKSSTGTEFLSSSAPTHSPYSTVEVNGSISQRIDSGLVNNNTLGANNNVILKATGTASDTFYLPAASSVIYRIYTFKKTDTGTTGTIVIIPNGLNTIDRQTVKITLTQSNPFTVIQSDGISNWYTLMGVTSGGGTQTWQQALTTGSILNTTNIVTNTGQVFTWTNGGTGVFDWSGLSHDTTSTFGLLGMGKDSSTRAFSWANVALQIQSLLPSDTIVGVNGITITSNPSGTRDTVWFGGTPLIQNTTLAFGSNNLTYSGSGTFIISTPLQITTGAGDRKVLTSDASGNASWVNFMPFSQTANGTALTNSTTATDLSGTGVGSTSIPGNTLHAGDVIVTHMTCTLSTAATPGTLTISSMLGNGITFTPQGGLTLLTFDITIRTTILTIGAGGTYSQEIFTIISGVNSNTNSNIFPSSSINTTVSNNFSVQGTWGTASSSNSIQSFPAGTNIKIN